MLASCDLSHPFLTNEESRTALIDSSCSDVSLQSETTADGNNVRCLVHDGY